MRDLGVTRHAGLDALRLLGAALVLLAHGAIFLFPLLPVYDVWLGLGWVGVEVFFALSGFLLTCAVLRAPPSTMAQALAITRARLARTWPLFVGLIALNAGLWWLATDDLPARLWAYPLLLQNSWATHPAFFGEAWNLPLLALYWLVIPLLAVGLQRRAEPRRALRNAFIALALLGLALRLGLVLWAAPEWDLGIRKWLPTRLDACAFGGLLACWAVRAPSANQRAQVALIGGLLLVLTLGLFAALPLDRPFAGAALFTLIGLALAMPLPWLCRGVSPAWLAASARAGFALYLINMPLIHGMLLFGPNPLSPLAGFSLWLLASVLLAVGIGRAGR